MESTNCRRNAETTISFIYNVKNIPPRTVPCRTLLGRSSQFDSVPSTTTLSPSTQPLADPNHDFFSDTFSLYLYCQSMMRTEEGKEVEEYDEEGKEVEEYDKRGRRY